MSTYRCWHCYCRETWQYVIARDASEARAIFADALGVAPRDVIVARRG